MERGDGILQQCGVTARREMMDKTDSRYPYTYACDYIRQIVGPEVSRSQASQVRQLLAQLAGVDDEEMARRIADKAITEWTTSPPY